MFAPLFIIPPTNIDIYYVCKGANCWWTFQNGHTYVCTYISVFVYTYEIDRINFVHIRIYEGVRTYSFKKILGLNGFVGWQHDVGLVKCRQMDNSQRVAIACFPLQRNVFSSCPGECEPMDPFEKWVACCTLENPWKLNSFARMWMDRNMCENVLSCVYSLHPMSLTIQELRLYSWNSGNLW